MIDLPPAFYIHVWPEAPYFFAVSAFSRHNPFVTFGIPLLSPNLFFLNCLVRKLILSLITPLLPFQLSLPCPLSASNLHIS